MPSRKLPPNEQVVDLYRSGLSSGEIAEQFGVKPVTVVCLLDRIGEPRRSTAEAAQLRSSSGRWKPISYWKGKKQPAELVERRVSKIRGDRHYNWKGGQRRGEAEYKRMPKEHCACCGAFKRLGIHHKDFDHYNNAPGNLEVLCVSCHMSLHKTEFWKAKREGREPRKSNGPVNWGRGK